MNQLKQQTPDAKRFRTIKICQLVIAAAALVCYAAALICIPECRPSVATITLHLAVWLLLLSSAVFLWMDLSGFYRSLMESDEIRHSAYLDDLTGMPNRFSCDLIFQMYAGDTDKIKHVACALITISNLIETNETLGRDAGNQILVDFCNILEEVGEDYGFVGRNGGNEFLLVIENCSKQHMDAFFEQLNTRLKRYNALDLNTPITIRYQYVLNDDLHETRFSGLITEVYKKLHAA